MGGTNIYTTSTGGGSLSTSSFAGAASVRTIAAGASKTLTLTFANNASSNLANYTGTGAFNPFGPCSAAAISFRHGRGPGSGRASRSGGSAPALLAAPSSSNSCKEKPRLTGLFNRGAEI